MGSTKPKEWRLQTPFTAVFFFCNVFLAGCQNEEPKRALQADPESNKQPIRLSAETVSRIERFCGDCHPLPLPTTFPKANWVEEIRQGYDFYIQSNRSDLVEPIRQDVVNYYQDLAPERVIVPRADGMKSVVSPVRSERSQPFGIEEPSPAIAHVVWKPSQKTVYFTDMRGTTLRA